MLSRSCILRRLPLCHFHSAIAIATMFSFASYHLHRILCGWVGLGGLVLHARMLIDPGRAFESHLCGEGMVAANGARVRVLQSRTPWAHRGARLRVPSLVTCRLTSASETTSRNNLRIVSL
jgi:hypothetical protein